MPYTAVPSGTFSWCHSGTEILGNSSQNPQEQVSVQGPCISFPEFPEFSCISLGSRGQRGLWEHLRFDMLDWERPGTQGERGLRLTCHTAASRAEPLWSAVRLTPLTQLLGPRRGAGLASGGEKGPASGWPGNICALVSSMCISSRTQACPGGPLDWACPTPCTLGATHLRRAACAEPGSSHPSACRRTTSACRTPWCR